MAITYLVNKKDEMINNLTTSPLFTKHYPVEDINKGGFHMELTKYQFRENRDFCGTVINCVRRIRHN